MDITEENLNKLEKVLADQIFCWVSLDDISDAIMLALDLDREEANSLTEVLWDMANEKADEFPADLASDFIYRLRIRYKEELDNTAPEDAPWQLHLFD